MRYNITMIKIISDSLLEKVKNIRQYITKFAVWFIIAIVGVGVISILFFEDYWDIVGRFLGTLIIIAIMVGVSINNIKRAAMDKPSVQILAMLGLMMNLVWTIISILLIWVPDLAMVEKTCGRYSYTCTEMSMLAKFDVMAVCLAFLGWVGSNIMAIYEGNRKSVIRPLKITATICLAYEMIFWSVEAFANFDLSEKWLALAGFTAVVWLVLSIVALVMSSHSEKKKTESVAKPEQEQAQLDNKLADAPLATDAEKEDEKDKKDKEVSNEGMTNDEKEGKVVGSEVIGNEIVANASEDVKSGEVSGEMTPGGNEDMTDGDDMWERDLGDDTGA